MRNKSVIIITTFMVIALIGVYVLFAQSSTGNVVFTNYSGYAEDESVSQIDLIKNTFPIMKTYCEDLKLKAISSGCPTCRYTEISDCTFVESSELENGQDVCYIKKIGDEYLLNVSRHLIFERNTRMDYVYLEFKLDKEGNIISQNLPEKLCV